MSKRQLFLTLALGAAALTAGCAHTPLAASVLAPGQTAAAAATQPYYSAVASKQLKGRALLVALHALVEKHTDLGYNPARDLMFGTIDDAKNNNEVVDVYTGRAIRGVTDTKSAFERGANTEHAWCQSMGAAGVAKDDLHILFPVDAGANSARNNHPYGEVAKTDSNTQDLPDFLGDGQHSQLGMGTGPTAKVMVFQPRPSQRGDMARAVLYFYTCYGHFDGKPDTIVLTNFKLEHDTLLKWSQQDPPSPWEVQRNEAIFKAQGNRNPYVDHPEWVSAIGRFI